MRRNTTHRPSGMSHRGRLALIAAMVGALLVLAIPAWSYYTTAIAPSNVWVARIDGETVMTRGDLVEAIVLRQLLSESPSNFSSLGRAPFLVAQAYVRDRLTREAAAERGVVVTEADLDAAVHETFWPSVQAGDRSTESELEQAYRATYTNFLSGRGVSDADYRSTVETRLYRERMIAAMPGGVEELEQLLSDRWAATAAEVRLDSDVYAKVVQDVRAALPLSLIDAQGE